MKTEELRTTLRDSLLSLAVIFLGISLGPIIVQAKGHKVPSEKDSVVKTGQNRSGESTADPPPTQTAPNHGVEVGPNYKIGPDDVLVVDVWKEPEISQTETVRPDGKITLPLVGDFMASGLTPKQLASEVSQKLEKYVDSPQVTVIVKETKSLRVNVLGQVAKPGSYPLDMRMTVLDAIAMAGGLKEFAKAKKIYVLRIGPNGNPIKLHFNYKKVIRGRDPGQNIQLRSTDTVVVP